MGAVRVHVDIPEKVLSGTVTGLACVYVSFGETAAPLEDVSSDATAAGSRVYVAFACSGVQEPCWEVLVDKSVNPIHMGHTYIHVCMAQF